MPDWTEHLTEEERDWVKVAQAYFPKALALRAGGMDSKAGETEAVVIELARTVASLRALVEEKDGALERVRLRALRIRQGEIETTSVGAADYDVQVAGLALALREDEMRKRLEEK